MSEIKGKVARATRWSALTEIVAKLVTPITSMVLARLLTPEAFGVVTTITMIITFAELFTDAGFQKYLVQHEFKDDTDRTQSTNVAFWSNFVMSLLIWGGIALFSEPLAALVGNPGLGHVVIIACAAIPLAAFSSIQMALYRRDLDFKTLFKVRVASILVPIVVTIPLTLWLRSYWALIIGHLTQNVTNAVLLTLFSRWKPRFYYSFAKLKEMFSFTVWSLIEHVSIWLTGYVDVFIVGTMLSQHYLGLYKTSSTLVGQIMGLVTAAATPVLFSSLSRLQNNDAEFKQMFFKFQKLVGILVFPLGIILFCFSDLITTLLLGSQWMEASGFIGLWGLFSALNIVFSHFSSEVYRALGRPKLSVLVQWLHIVVLWPVVLVAVGYGFETLYTARSWVRLELMAANLVVLYYVVHITLLQMVRNVFPSLVASLMAMGVAMTLRMVVVDNLSMQLVSLLSCAVAYIAILALFPKERKTIRRFLIRK
jgi:PST family polysaccharide transporter